MIWIIGEYAERIDNADELLESFLDGFQDENAQVQLQLLTAIVKLFLKRPTDTQELVQQVLSLATQDSDNPDLRDRGYIYWRLLSTDPAAAKEVVLAEKPLIPLRNTVKAHCKVATLDGNSEIGAHVREAAKQVPTLVFRQFRSINFFPLFLLELSDNFYSFKEVIFS